MAIDSIGYSANTSTVATTASSNASSSSTTDSTASESTETTGAAVSDAAVYEPSSKTQKSAVSASDIRRMIDETNKQTDALREMILKMIDRQASKDSTANSLFGKNSATGTGMIEIDDETRSKAQKDIAEGGYYSVENTGDRILSFAFAIAGDDPEKLSKMRDAALAGFDAAEKQWGGKLPSISYDTKEYVTKGFEEKMASITSK